MPQQLMSYWPTNDEHPMQIIEESNGGQEEKRSSGLPLPTRSSSFGPRYRRGCSEYVPSDERNTSTTKRDFIHEMYLRSKQQYKQCISDEEQ